MNALTFDSLGNRVLDCQVTTDDPDGISVAFLGLDEPECDESVVLRVSAAFEDR
jgi:hypothetical protein